MKKFIYIDDISGADKEAFAYEQTDFVSVATPNKPVITTGAGTLHPSLIPAAPVGNAVALVITREADGDILRGDLVRASAGGKVKVADSNIAQDDATVLGIALEDKLNTELVEILVLGIINDPMFNIFPVNSSLFLDIDGAVTDDRPAAPSRKYLTYIGKSLGSGEVLISINPPLTLGA